MTTTHSMELAYWVGSLITFIPMMIVLGLAVWFTVRGLKDRGAGLRFMEQTLVDNRTALDQLAESNRMAKQSLDQREAEIALLRRQVEEQIRARETYAARLAEVEQAVRSISARMGE